MPHNRLLLVVGVLCFGQLVAAENASLMFVYSQRETPARSWMPVACDGKNIAEIRRGFFFAVSLPPGRHSLLLRDSVPISIEIRPENETFVRLDWSQDVRRSPIPVLSRVPAEIAKKEMQFLSYIEAKRIHSTGVSREDPRPSDGPRLKTRNSK